MLFILSSSRTGIIIRVSFALVPNGPLMGVSVRQKKLSNREIMDREDENNTYKERRLYHIKNWRFRLEICMDDVSVALCPCVLRPLPKRTLLTCNSFSLQMVNRRYSKKYHKYYHPPFCHAGHGYRPLLGTCHVNPLLP